MPNFERPGLPDPGEFLLKNPYGTWDLWKDSIRKIRQSVPNKDDKLASERKEIDAFTADLSKLTTKHRKREFVAIQTRIANNLQSMFDAHRGFAGEYGARTSLAHQKLVSFLLPPKRGRSVENGENALPSPKRVNLNDRTLEENEFDNDDHGSSAEIDMQSAADNDVQPKRDCKKRKETHLSS